MIETGKWMRKAVVQSLRIASETVSVNQRGARKQKNRRAQVFEI